MIYPKLLSAIERLLKSQVPHDRQLVLNHLQQDIQGVCNSGGIPLLIFICTHNSRRSQFAQVWASVAAHQAGISCNVFSGGTEVTQCHPAVIESLKRSGFEVDSDLSPSNPRYSVQFDPDAAPVELWSKVYDNEQNPPDHFIAVMVCSDADAHCPIIPGCDHRIVLTYEDPKPFDQTPEEANQYDNRSAQIAAEFFYLFSNLNQPQ